MKTKQSYPASMNRGRQAAPVRIQTALHFTACVLLSAVACVIAPAAVFSQPAPVRFGVISDPHLAVARICTPGEVYEEYVTDDPKLLRESEAILEAALAKMIQENVRFVLVPGDLTKDGEVASHVAMKKHLHKLEQRGIQALVVPGNHDLNNPDAQRFRESSASPVPSVSPATFKALYKQFGYGEAIDCDPDSLSYVTEPVPGLWVVGIDSTDTAQNETLGYPVVGGKLSPSTLAWVMEKVQVAQTKGKQVIAFMHHGMNPDFAAQPLLFPEYLVNDWPVVNLTLAGAGLRVIFTGHYHAQDTSYFFDANGVRMSPLCDVGTSSLAAYPCGYRVVTMLDGGLMRVESRRVTEINADTGGMTFQEYAEADVRERTLGIAKRRLLADFGLGPDQAELVAPLVVDAVVAGYEGDEAPDAQTREIIDSLVKSDEPLHTLGLLLYALWTDLPVEDNDVVVPFVAD